QVILSQKLATKLFGDINPVGEPLVLEVDGQSQTYTIAAVAKKLEEKSSIRFDILMRIEEYADYQRTLEIWDDYFMDVFVQLPADVDQATFEKRLKGFTEKYFEEEISQLKESGYVPNPDGSLYRLKLLNIRDLHFSEFLSRFSSISILYPISFILMGIFILIIACGNFINLSLGTSMRRALEVGVRKVLGASRQQIIYQFWSETLMLILLALAFALMTVQWLLPEYNALLKDDIKLFNPYILSALGIVLFIITLGAGAYPAMVISRFQPASILKKQTKVQKPGFIRNLLVIAQFASSIFLIACTFIVLLQLNFMRSQPLGFNKDQVISIPLSAELDGRTVLDRFRSEFEQHSSVLSITGATRNLGLGRNYSNTTSSFGIEQKGKLLQFRWMNVDYDYFSCLDIELLEGRPFNREMATDTAAVIINEGLAALLDEEEIIGSYLETEPRRQIIGIIKNFHMDALNIPIAPAAFGIDKGWPIYYVFAKVRADKSAEMLALFEEKWATIAPGSRYSGSFLDENVARQYEQEEVMSQITVIAAIIAILLSCLGLFAIALLTIIQRTKEIGIRKVLGASISSLVLLLSSSFLRLVAVAALIAIPLAWYGMRIWLQEYHYHIEPHWWVFALAGLMAMLIAFATVSAQGIKAALSNPIEALRTE
ncbi:MAG: FtsX-like permease family protein, partial [Bacteroidota bacterium]